MSFCVGDCVGRGAWSRGLESGSIGKSRTIGCISGACCNGFVRTVVLGSSDCKCAIRSSACSSRSKSCEVNSPGKLSDAIATKMASWTWTGIVAERGIAHS